MSFYPAPSRRATAIGLLTISLFAGLSACQRPAGYFQPSHREVFYSSAPKQDVPETRDNVPAGPDQNVPEPVLYANARPASDLPAEAPDNQRTQSAYPVVERVRQHQSNARRLLMSAAETTPNVPNPTRTQDPGPKPKKTLREILGLPPRKRMNWWQRISWQLKASIVVVMIAVVFAILHITILAIIFGIIGAYLLIRGLKKSFKVRSGIFNWRLKR